MSILIMVLPILLIFMTMRGQTEEAEADRAGPQDGRHASSPSRGSIGKVTEFIGETRVKVEIAPGVTVRMLKSAISGIDGGERQDRRRKDKPRTKRPKSR